MTHIPIGRFGEAVEVAKAVLFREIAWSSFLRRILFWLFPVATDESSFMTVRPLRPISNTCSLTFHRALISWSTEESPLHILRHWERPSFLLHKVLLIDWMLGCWGTTTWCQAARSAISRQVPGSPPHPLFGLCVFFTRCHIY